MLRFLSSHSPDRTDPFLRPAFDVRSKVKRFVWIAIWRLFFRTSPTLFHNYRAWLLRCFGARIGAKNFIYPTSQIWAPWLLSTDDVVTIGPNVEIYNPANIHLGHHTIVSQDAFLCGATHDYESADFTYIAKRIVTEPYTWICARSIVLPGVTCGQGSVLGAGSVTSKDLEPWTVYAGNPALKVKLRQKTIAVQNVSTSK
jgi:putative colanic acid biosynthesis acetyltransferase WcaF